LFPRFGRFTTSCDEPKASEAGRFSADIVAAGNRYRSTRGAVVVKAALEVGVMFVVFL
jgi:hypothetical protein